jgi:hypothetical protein
VKDISPADQHSAKCACAREASAIIAGEAETKVVAPKNVEDDGRWKYGNDGSER